MKDLPWNIRKKHASCLNGWGVHSTGKPTNITIRRFLQEIYSGAVVLPSTGNSRLFQEKILPGISLKKRRLIIFLPKKQSTLKQDIKNLCLTYFLSQHQTNDKHHSRLEIRFEL